MFMNSCLSSNLDTITMPKPPENGSKEYISGWEDGCKTGISQFSNAYYRMKYNTSTDNNLIQNKEYIVGWKLGNRYCSYYSSTYLSNKEFFQNDLRSKNTWFSLKSDGFFSYKNAEKITW